MWTSKKEEEVGSNQNITLLFAFYDIFNFRLLCRLEIKHTQSRESDFVLSSLN